MCWARNPFYSHPLARWKKNLWSTALLYPSPQGCFLHRFKLWEYPRITVQLRKWLNPSTNHPLQIVLSQKALAYPWPLSWQGDGYLGKAKLFPLDVSPEWFFQGYKHRASSWPPALLFDQQGFCSACAAEDLPTPPDWLTLNSRELPLFPGVSGQHVRSYWICLMELSLYRWEGTARAQLGCSHRVLQTEIEMFPGPSALGESAASHPGGC